MESTAVHTKPDLVTRLQEHRDALRQHGVRRIGVFGSFQQDSADAESDVDLLVEFWGRL